MELDELITEVNTIFIEVLEDETIELNEYTTSDEIESWDSLNHIQVITAIESHYKVCFEVNELLNFNNIGDMCRCLQQKLK